MIVVPYAPLAATAGVDSGGLLGTIVLYGLVGAFVLGGLAWGLRGFVLADRQMNAMAKFARLNHLEFAPATGAYVGAFQSYPFNSGSDQRDVAWIGGTFNGRRCSSYTHEYEEKTNNDRPITRRWQIALVELEYPLETLDIVPDDAEAKAAKALGGMDIDFESAAFNARWRVVAGNLKYAHDVINPRMMERLLELDAQGLYIRIEGKAVMCYERGRHGPEDLARRLLVLTAVAKLIPDFVLREFEYEHKKQEEEARKREENAPDWAKTPFALSSGHYTELGKKLAAESELEYIAGGEDGPGAKPETTPRPDDEERAW